MDFIEGSIGIYRPLVEFFDTPSYKQSMETCWNAISYKLQIGLLAELFVLQQKNLIPSEVTADEMADLLVEETKKSIRVKLWEYEVEDCFEAESKLVFEVNTSMKMRDIEFEARRLLDSPEMIPSQLKHTTILRKARQFAGSLEQQKATYADLLNPRAMVIKVLPKVLQIFWLPPPTTPFTMPSKYLSKMAVGVTQAVLDRISQKLSYVQLQFSYSIRDNLVLSIHEKVRQAFTAHDLVESIHSFQPRFLKTITDVTVEEIGTLFVLFGSFPSSPSADLSLETTSVPDDDNLLQEPTKEKDSIASRKTVALASAQLPPSSKERDNISQEVTTVMQSLLRNVSNYMKMLFVREHRLRS
ncbi:uncharacterized protein LOC127600317 isoform X1 [Hippocampus zosterae]|uniref:uncharacterized protein LOC127600317 isoform X1 n=2 Tax=Hippocampus zosterae TaxID=109293 RepID=UPI00223D905A|nr:uncharacterized protein LOC127600317 isoform X1 [Hippocampus zosterae]